MTYSLSSPDAPQISCLSTAVRYQSFVINRIRPGRHFRRRRFVVSRPDWRHCAAGCRSKFESSGFPTNDVRGRVNGTCGIVDVCHGLGDGRRPQAEHRVRGDTRSEQSSYPSLLLQRSRVSGLSQTSNTSLVSVT